MGIRSVTCLWESWAVAGRSQHYALCCGMVRIASVLYAWLTWYIVACATAAPSPKFLHARKTLSQLRAASGLSLCSQLIFTLMVSGCSPQGSCTVFFIGKRKRGFLPLCLFPLWPLGQPRRSTPSRSNPPPCSPWAKPGSCTALAAALAPLEGLGSAL